MARAPKAPPLPEGAPAEPDLLGDAPAPRETQTFIGHAETVEALAKAMRARPPQALLFEGPRGIGKATLAFRLARALLAAPEAIAADLSVDPQGRTARQIAAGTHPGLIHLTRPYDEKAKRFKSELTVDTVRRIIPFLGATAAGGGWRVVIVDAVDDMNASAANALLKSLEEPPKRTLFVLIAHVSGLVLPTLRSRCRSMRLRPLAEAEVAEALGWLGADPALAAAGGGSVRAALGLAAMGADVVERTQRLLAPRALADPANHHILADVAATRRADTFAAVVDLIVETTARRARDGAASLPPAALAHYAGVYLDALSERRRLDIFNLDRREYVLALLHSLRQADRAAQIAP